MSVMLRGKKFHYRFMVDGVSYSGVCEGCGSRQEAEALEAQIRERSADIRRNKTVRALIDNYRYELTGGKPISLSEAYDLAEAKPSKREASESYRKLRKLYWSDFVAFMTHEFPRIRHLADVRRAHCEAYVKHLVTKGRFIRTVVNDGQTYQWKYGAAPKTVKAIVAVCRWVFTRLEEDAGLAGCPWNNVVLPAPAPIDREVFTVEELRLIHEGIQHNPFQFVLFFVAANSGLTEGDICTLRWDDVDWANGFLRRDRRKTGTPIDIPLMPEMEAFIQGQVRRNEYIFPEHAAMYLHQSVSVSKRIGTFLRNLGIKTTVEVPGRRAVSVKDLHSMRHVFCYRAKRAGIPESVIAKIVGHKVLAMTQHYADHDTDDDLRREMKKLPPLFVGEAGAISPAIDPRKRLANLAYSLPLEKVEELLAAARPELPCRQAAM